MTRTVAGPASSVRGVVLALLAGVLMWFVVLWAVEAVLEQLYAQEDAQGALAMSWVGNIGAPALSTVISALLVPEIFRGRLLPTLMIATPVPIVGCVRAVLRAGGPDQNMVLLVGMGLVIMTLVIAGVMARLTVRQLGNEGAIS